MTTFQLKLLALLLMLIDHIGYYFEGTPAVLRLIGRLSFPLFLFCMTQGWRHTRDRKKYLLRLYGMSLVMACIMYLCGAGYGYHNILITFFWVGVLVSAAELFQKDIRMGCAAYGLIAISHVLFTWVWRVIPGARHLSGDILHSILPNPIACEYGIPYVLLGVAMYFLWENRAAFCAAYLLLALIEFCNGDTQWLIALALPFILRWNGEKGRSCKWFFYLFYPAHTLALFWLASRV